MDRLRIAFEPLECLPENFIPEFMYFFPQPKVNFLHNGRKFITTLGNVSEVLIVCSKRLQIRRKAVEAMGTVFQ